MVVLGYGGGRDAFFFFLCNKHHDGQQHIDGYKIWGASESFLGVGREEEEGGGLFDDQSLPFSVFSDHFEDGRTALVPSAVVVFYGFHGRRLGRCGREGRG